MTAPLLGNGLSGKTPDASTSARVKPSVEQADTAPNSFNPDEYDWPNHLKKAIGSLKTKVIAIDRCWAYYDNEHPRVWLTDDIRKKLDDKLVTDMAENWCDTTVDAPVKRLAVTSFTQPDKQEIETKAATNVWEDNDLDLGQKDLYTQAGVAGEGFLFAWKDDDKPAGFDATVVDARRVWWPDDAHRSKPVRVVQIWADEDEEIWRATCYYKWVVVRLRGRKWRGEGDPMPEARYFEVDPDDPGGIHGFEYPPVIRFALHKRRKSVIDSVRSIQDKINKLSANLLVTAEFNSWRKTAFLTEQKFDDGDLTFRPNRALLMDPGGGPEAAATSIWEGSETNLANISDRIDGLIDKLFSKAMLPGHMKVQSSKTLPSGAAYEADEGPYVENVKDMQRSYGASWTDFYQLILGIDVRPQWVNPKVSSDTDEMANVKTAVDAGVPLALALRKLAGWSDEEIKELEEAPLSPKEQLSMAAAQALANGGGPNGQASAGGDTEPGAGTSGAGFGAKQTQSPPPQRN